MEEKTLNSVVQRQHLKANYLHIVTLMMLLGYSTSFLPIFMTIAQDKIYGMLCRPAAPSALSPN